MHIPPVLPLRRVCSIIKHRITDHLRRVSRSWMSRRILEFLGVPQLVVGTGRNYAGSAATVSLVKAGMEICLDVEDSQSNTGLGAVREMWKIAFSMPIEKGWLLSLISGEESFHMGRLAMTLSNIAIIIPSWEYTRP